MQRSSHQKRQVRQWGHSSAGRAPALHAGGLRFDPAWLHHYPIAQKFRNEYLDTLKIESDLNIDFWSLPELFFKNLGM